MAPSGATAGYSGLPDVAHIGLTDLSPMVLVTGPRCGPQRAAQLGLRLGFNRVAQLELRFGLTWVAQFGYMVPPHFRMDSIIPLICFIIIE